MKVLIFLISNIVIAAYLFTKHYDQKYQYLTAYSQTHCINATRPQYTICATCYIKTLTDNKGFLITQNKFQYLLLQSKINQSILSCKDYIQMVDVNTVPSLKIDTSIAIREVISVIEGQTHNIAVSKKVVPAQYNAFTIFRAFSKTQSSSQPLVQKPNPQHIKIIFSFYFYLLNTVGLIAIVMFCFKPIFYSKISPKVLISLVLEFISIQLATLHLIEPQIGIKLARLLLISATLYRLQLKDNVALITIMMGILMQFHQLTWILYLMIVMLVLTLKGAGNQELREMWIYLFVSIMLILPLFSVSYFLFRDISNSACLFIEISLLILTPIGIIGLIHNHRLSSIKLFTSRDPERYSISLSGFEQQQDDDEN